MVNKKKIKALSTRDWDRIIEMAWEDRTPFDAIERQFGLSESEVIWLMRRGMKANSFRHWRKHVSGRKTKHEHKLGEEKMRFKSNAQRQITFNKLSKPK